jgi:hypothetical protein
MNGSPGPVMPRLTGAKSVGERARCGPGREGRYGETEPIGMTERKLRRNVPGVLISALDPERDLYDSTAAWRDRALAGVLHSGTAVSDPRSDDRTRI